MTPALNLQTIEAHPLGKPSDRLRYGMTPAMAIVYADLVERFGDRPHDPFIVHMRGMAMRFLNHHSHIHGIVRSLVERGWVEPTTRDGAWTKYRFVHPVMRFPNVPNIWSDW